MKLVVLTALAMLAFAGNSLLCRLALLHTGIDAATFTSVRLISGALVLWLIAAQRSGAGTKSLGGGWLSAVALFVYAEAFSFAYLSLPAGTGALLLFAAVQISMIGWGLYRGERLARWQIAGFALAVGGLVFLLLPGLSAPPLQGALLMTAAGVAWAVYSLRAKGAGDPTRATAGNFVRAAPLALAVSAAMLPSMQWDPAGIGYGLASGILSSGIGYVIWYAALRELKMTSAATVQLSVPVIAAFGGVLFLDESVSLRLVMASAAVLGGVAVVLLARGRPSRRDALTPPAGTPPPSR
ncbi:DMT family transporter [Variovorax sp. J22P240]|uniref:DMT family transporter n=1 Tax=Variovorax sp. J22P240 TaxID=3053514 RepID=UPI0025765DD4|nr:DMT family transporter [Variovorax sp. J22P240]MDM0000096.1 DMT family transporter [Variovorax sp. J22P240]